MIASFQANQYEGEDLVEEMGGDGR
jgi:hypothetical protein